MVPAIIATLSPNDRSRRSAANRAAPVSLSKVPVLYTFDVFDTLLTRRVGAPSSVFLALGRQLVDQSVVRCSAEVYARARALAEPLAATGSAHGTTTLAAICDRLAALLDEPPELAPVLAAAEAEAERAYVVAVPGAHDLITRARASGARIAFVSDMYLPTELVRQLLVEHRLATPGDRVYVSGDVGLSKRSGTLFGHVLDAQRARPADTVHVGDDAVADQLRPHRLGIGLEPQTAAVLNRYEERLERHRWESDGLSSALAGASRWARLATPASGAHHVAIRDVTAGAAAPLLVGYVRWLLERARTLRLDRLYFVARDAEVLLDTAERLPGGAAGPELRYLYGSRQAWYPAGVDPDAPGAALDALSGAFDDTLASLLDRCGVDPARWLDRPTLARLRSDPTFLGAVREGLRGRQERLGGYLDQVGLLEPGRFGVVDLGWTGRSLHELSALLARHGRPAPLGFYLGLRGGLTLRQPTEVWLAGLEPQLRYLMMETFCAGRHGQVLDFRSEGAAFAPVLKHPVNQAAVDWGLPVLRDTMASFADFLADTPPSPATANVRHAALDSFRLFYRSPSRAEAAAWGAFPFEVGLSADRPERLASGRPLAALVRARLDPSVPSPRWPDGDLALAPSVWRGLVHGYRGGKQALTRRRTATRGRARP